MREVIAPATKTPVRCPGFCGLFGRFAVCDCVCSSRVRLCGKVVAEPCSLQTSESSEARRIEMNDQRNSNGRQGFRGVG